MTVRTATDTGPSLDELAHLIALNGIANYECDISVVVARLRTVGHSGTLIDLLADRHAPSIVRERAFGNVVGRLARGPATPTVIAAAA